MSYGFPDWMFAAIAIAAYEIAAWIRHRFHLPHVMSIAFGIVIICAVVILIRYIIRASRKQHDDKHEDDDDWRNY